MMLQQNPTTSYNSKALIFDFNLFNFSTQELEYVYRIQSIRYSLPWFIVTFGLIGNFFIGLIFIRRKTRGFSSNAFCFCTLAIIDSMALVFMLLQSMLSLHILNNLSVACKLIKFIFYSSLQLSSWSLVLLTIDRLIAVSFIFKYKTWNKKFWAPKIFIGIFVCIILLNFHILIMTESQIKKKDIYDIIPTKKFSSWNSKFTSFQKNEQKLTCSVNRIKYPFYSKYIFDNWDIYHALIYGGLPFLIIFISNVVIILKLGSLKKSKISKNNIKISESNKSLDKIDKSIKSIQITVMLLSVAFVFLIFTSPISFYMTFFYRNLNSINRIKLQYIKVVLNYIAYINNAINFYLYVSLSTEFRKEFIQLFISCKTLKPFSSISKCTTLTRVESFDKNEEQKESRPLRRPIVRKGLKFKNFDLKNQVDLAKPFISSDQDAVEQYKIKNRYKRLFFYKNEKISNPSIPGKRNDGIFVNSVSTLV